MPAARMRDEEAKAIKALQALDVLDSGAEAEFDALVRAAAAVCGVPISVISLVDIERQWFKAAVGLPGVSETPRDVAFCAHAVLADELFEVPDATQDPRFADNPLVTGQPDIRFYAGAPVRLTDGERIGTICVIDREPRQLNANQREVLMCLAEAAARALEGRRALRQVAHSLADGARAALLLEHSADAIISATPGGHVTRWNSAAAQLFGYAASDIVGQSLDCLAPPELQCEYQDLFARAGETEALTFESVRVRRDGGLLNVSITAVPEFDADGTLTGVTKFVRDITAQVQTARRLVASEERTRRLYESTPAMLHSIDPQGRLLAVSDQWLGKLGYERHEVIGRYSTEFLTTKSRAHATQEVLPRFFATGRVDDVAYQFQSRSGEVLDVLLSARLECDEQGLPLRTLAVMEDVTLRLRAERELRVEKDRLANILDGTHAGTWEYAPATGAFAVNDSFRDMLGQTPADASPVRVEEFTACIHPSDRPAFTDSLQAHVRGATPSFEAEFRLMRADRSWVWVLSRARAVARDDAGLALKVSGIQMDISDRVALSEAKETVRRDLQTILDALPSMIGYWDKDLVNRFANKSYQLGFNTSHASLTGMRLPELLGDELFERNRAFVDAALRGEPQTFERSGPAPDGQGQRHSLAHYLPDVVDGEVRGFYALVHDVTELKETRQRAGVAARRSEALLDMIQRHTIFSVTDGDGRITDVNEAFCRLAGYDQGELIGQTHRIVDSREHSASFWMAVWREIASGRSWRGEVCNRAKDGSLYWIESIITPLLGETGRVENYISLSFDITAAKGSERALRDSEAFLERTGRLAGIGGWEVDMRSQRIRWSPETYRIHELDPAATPPLTDAMRFFPPECRPVLEQAFAEAASSGKRYDLELPFVSALGRRKWVRTVGEAEVVDGKVVRLLGSLQDISERKLAEAALRATNDRFKLAADAAGMGVWEYDLQDGSLIWDDGMYQLYGRQRADAVAPYALWAENLHPDDRERSERELALALDGSQPFEPEFRIRWPDGSIRHLKASAMVQRDAEGRALRMIGVNLDITERKSAEEAISRTSALLQGVLDAASEVSIIAVDLNGTVTVFNTGAERLSGCARLDMLGTRRSLEFHDREELRQRARLLSAEAGRSVPTGQVLMDPAALGRAQEWTYRRQDGNAIRVSLTVTAMREASGECFGYLGVAHDISRQKEYERSLRAAALAAQRANVAKSQFLANMSHEIRTPLNALIGVGHLLAGTPLDDDQRQLLGKSQVAGRSLLGIVNNVLDLAKIEAGELTLDEVPFQPGQLLRDLDAMFRVEADEKRLTLDLRCGDDVPPRLVGDPQRLRQMLVNLVGNALKFTQQGGVSVMLQVLERGESVVRLRCSVHDTGIGIDADAQERLFKAFSQADSSTTRRFGGTGLGLSIVRQLAQAMGGEVGVNSALGQGSEFWAEIGLAMPTSAQSELVSEDGSTLEVLIVDDNVTDQQALASYSRALGWRAVQMDSGAAMVALIEERLSVGTALPDALVVDQQMPGMTGLQAIGSLVHLLGRERLPAVLVVSMHDRDRIAALDSQRLADHILTKPVDTSDLFNAVNDSVALRTGSTSRVLQSTRVGGLQARWLVGMRLLVVDDSDINREVARRMLEREGALVHTCNNGLEALACLRAQPDDFHAVLMDVQMPEMDGLEATRRLRGEHGLTLPVVALTAGALAEERRRALDAGMTEFMSKPLDPQTLVRTLRRVVEAQFGGAPAVHRSTNDPVASTSWPAIDGIDTDAAFRSMGGDAELFLSLLQRLLREFGDLALPTLALPPESTLHAAFTARVHKLRGSLGTLGALKAHRLATQAEKTLTEARLPASQDLADLGAALRALFDAAAPLLSARSAMADEATQRSADASTDPPLTQHELEELLGLVRRQEMAALDRFEALAPRLRRLLGLGAFQKIAAALDGLDFAAAAELLDGVSAQNAFVSP